MPKQKQPKKVDDVFKDFLNMELDDQIQLLDAIKEHFENQKKEAKELAEKLEKI